MPSGTFRFTTFFIITKVLHQQFESCRMWFEDTNQENRLLNSPLEYTARPQKEPEISPVLSYSVAQIFLLIKQFCSHMMDHNPSFT